MHVIREWRRTYTERECVMIGRCDVLSGGPFQRKFLTVWALLNPCPDATNAMGALPAHGCRPPPPAAALCAAAVFISSRRPAGRFAAGPPRAPGAYPPRRTPRAERHRARPLFGGHDASGQGRVGRIKEWAGPRAGQQGDLGEICVTSYVTGP
jgi:hypothetical protein